MKRIICLILGHDYYRVRKLKHRSELVGCHRCKNYYGMNNDVRAILPFTSEMEEMYRSFGCRGLKKYITNDKWFSLIRG